MNELPASKQVPYFVDSFKKKNKIRYDVNDVFYLLK
jgi:hypothetical protein